MSATTLTRHHPSELTFAGADDILNVVHFTAPSRGTAGKVNTVSLDTVSGAIHCDCTAATVGTSSCWHGDWVSAAWANHEARQLARRFTSGQLMQTGRKLAHMCKTYRARVWKCVPQDQVMLVAARCEYRERAALAAAPSQLAA